MKTVRMVFMYFLGTMFVTGCGPSPQKRPTEAAEIRSNYVAFRMAVINSNWPVIRSFLSEDFEKIYLKDRIFHQGYLTPESVPSTNAFVEFDSAAEAWLRPQSEPLSGPQVGIGFIKEANGWKISGTFKPIILD